MKNYTYKNLLALLVFLVLLWSVNLFVTGLLTDNLEDIKAMRKELFIKESFISQGDTGKLSKSINDFVPEKLDKLSIINYVNQLTRDYSVKIVSIDVQEIDDRERLQFSLENEGDNLNSSADASIQNTETKINTLKKAELIIQLKGNKQSLDKFLDKLVESRQYIDIKTINFDFKIKSNDVNDQDISLNIIANIYYKK
jgi:hypothetical protein